MGLSFDIDPHWDIKDYKILDYKLDKHKDNKDNQQYINAGHLPQSLTLYNYFEPNPMPDSIDYIKSHFSNFTNISVAVNYFKPGQYMPFHYDRFTAYKNYYNIKQNCDVHRYMIMLEAHQQGQMLQINNTIHNNWIAGSIFGWRNNDKHTFFNLGVDDRYAVQLTATPKN